MSEAVVIRSAGVDDVVLLAAVEAAAGERFRDVDMAEIADDEPPPVDELEQAVVEGRLWVADAGGQVVGYAWALDQEGLPYLEQVSVLPNFSGRGVGRALVDRVCEWAGTWGSTLTLSTFVEVPWNAPLYERLGFTVIPPEELDERLLKVHAEEVEAGLDHWPRVFMRRQVG